MRGYSWDERKLGPDLLLQEPNQGLSHLFISAPATLQLLTTNFLKSLCRRADMPQRTPNYQIWSTCWRGGVGPYHPFLPSSGPHFLGFCGTILGLLLLSFPGFSLSALPLNAQISKVFIPSPRFLTPQLLFFEESHLCFHDFSHYWTLMTSKGMAQPRPLS